MSKKKTSKSKPPGKAHDRAKLEGLKAFCRSERQTELLEAVLEWGSIRAAAKNIGCGRGTITRAIIKIERGAALQGFSPDHDMTKVCPDTHFIKGTSTLYGDNGEVRLQWVKTNKKMNDLLCDLRDFADALGEGLSNHWKPTAKPKNSLADVLTVYPLADAHIGLLSWSAETREDYDLVIASDAVKTAAELVIGKSPESKTAIVANLGDLFHFDNDKKQTTSGNILDADGRWSKVVKLGVETMLYFIRLALEKHETVKVVNTVGNHDGQTALMLPLILAPYFRDEPRVIIEDAPRLHHYHKFGKNLLGFHHGHATAPNRLPMVMVNDCMLNAEFDSQGVEFCHWLTGHIHHISKEYDGVLVESFRALTAKDAWHSGAGYRAGRDIQSVSYHNEFGEIARDRVSFKEVQFHSTLSQTKTSTTRNP